MSTPKPDQAAQPGAPSPEILERNLDQLLGEAAAPPRLDDAARARVRSAMHKQLGAASSTRSGAPRARWALGLGLVGAAAAGVAFVATRDGRRGASDGGAGVSAPLPGPLVAGDRPTAFTIDGAAVVLDAGARLETVAPRHVRVTGRALFDVTPGRGRYLVETAAGQAEVLGTRFMLMAEGPRTQAAVVRGSVKLIAAAGEVTLGAGEEGTLHADGPPTRAAAPRLSQLTSWAEAARRELDPDASPRAPRGSLTARVPNPPGPEQPLPMHALTVDVTIDNQVARVALDQTFYNPESQLLEGMYRFAIPADASLQRLAMYVDGKLMESAVVERMKARAIYEDLVYRRVDPALLEYAGAGRLDLKVYPLPPQQEKRLLVAYTQSLPRLHDDWTVTVPLPEVAGTVDQFEVAMRVRGCARCELHSPSHPIVVSASGDDAIVTVQAKDATVGDSLVVVARDPQATARVVTYDDTERGYVHARVPVALQASQAATGDAARAPRRWVILDDVSASRDALALRAQAAIVARVLGEVDEQDTVSVLTFDTTAREVLAPTRAVDVDRLAVRKLLRERERGGVGATDLGRALDRAVASLAGAAPADAFVVYLGDGVVTGGERGLDALRQRLVGKATFVGIGVGDGVELPTLAALADATGGLATTIDLADDVGFRAYDAIAALYTERIVGLGVVALDGAGTATPGASAYVRAGQLAAGEELELVAAAPRGASIATLRVTGTRAGTPWRLDVPVPPPSTTAIAAPAPRPGDEPAGYLPRLWAARHIGALMLAKTAPLPPDTCQAAKGTTCPDEQTRRDARDELLRKEIVALGKQQFLLSRHTSLLVLENDAMYAQYGVVKGAGATWQPYVVPATIPVKTIAPSTKLLAAGVPALRPRQRWFLDLGGNGAWDDPRAASWGTILGTAVDDSIGGLGLGMIGAGPTTGTGVGYGIGSGRGAGGGGTGTVAEKAIAAPTVPDDSTPRAEAMIEGVVERRRMATSGDARELDLPRASRTTNLFAAQAGRFDDNATLADRTGGGLYKLAEAGPGRRSGAAPLARAGQRYPAALQYSSDPALTDLVGWLPALLVGEVDDQLAGLAALRPGGASAPSSAGKVEAGAQAQLEAARAALPSGTYGIGAATPVAMSGGAWRWVHTDEVGLLEHASFDGTTWRRSYPELGLSITRADDGLAMAMASVYLPMAVPSAAQLAAFYDVTLASPRVVRLTPRKAGVDAALTLTFDAADHLVAVKRADGETLTSITWDAAGPTALSVGAQTWPVTFSPAISTAAPATAGLVELHQPLGDPAARLVEASASTVGSAAWRTAVRHGLAAAAVVRDQRQAALLYAELRKGGPLALGELTLASSLIGGLGEPARAALRREVAPDASALAAYLLDRAATPAPAVIAPAAPAPGLLGTLATMRSILRIADRSSSSSSVDTALTLFAQLPAEAAVLRYLAAIALTERSQLDRRALTPMWDALASGRDRNIARADAAHWLGRSDRNLGAERTVALLRDYDLAAAPVALDGSVRWAVSGGAGGDAAWQLAWKAAVTRVLASDALEHVLAFATFGQPETPALLARASVLAGTRPDAIEQVASLAMAQGQVAVAAGVLARLPAGASRSPALERLMAELDAAQGRPAQAAAALERALASDERTGVEAARLAVDFQRLLTLYRDALRAAPAAEQPALQASLLAAIERWRGAAPDDGQVATFAGELLLELGLTEEAWRQLSTQVELAPMDGAPWATLAGVFTRAGQGERALGYWQEAVILDQTNPTPRLEQARLYYALGRAAEGDARLKEISGRRWHDRWSWVTYQAAQLERERAAIR